jgi:hypothetical protein
LLIPRDSKKVIAIEESITETTKSIERGIETITILTSPNKINPITSMGVKTKSSGTSDEGEKYALKKKNKNTAKKITTIETKLLTNQAFTQLFENLSKREALKEAVAIEAMKKIKPTNSERHTKKPMLSKEKIILKEY